MAYKNILSNKNILLLEGDSTPAAEGLTGPVGSLYINKGNGKLWIQGTAGTTASWTIIGSGNFENRKEVEYGETFTVDTKNQNIVYGNFTLDGDYVNNEELVIINGNLNIGSSGSMTGPGSVNLVSLATTYDLNTGLSGLSASLGNYLPLAGGTMSGIIDTNFNAIYLANQLGDIARIWFYFFWSSRHNNNI